MKQILTFFPLVLLLLVGCKREQAVWESDWQAPLLKDSLTLDHLVEESFLSVNGGYYELDIDRTIYELNLADVVDIPDTTVKHIKSLPNFNVPPGTSFVSNEVKEHIIALGDIELKEIRIKSGGIAISVLNPIGTKTFFTVELPGVTKNGITLSQEFIAPAGTNANPGQIDGFVDLSGYKMDLRGANQGSFNKIQSKLSVKSDPAGPTVTTSNMDSVKFLFTMNDVKIDYARGYFGNQLLTDTITENIEAFNKIASGLIDLPASNLELELVNGLKVSAKVKLTELKNTNNQGNEVSMAHSSINSWITINSATGTESALNPSTTTLEFNAANSNTEQFLENHGAKNDIGFELQLNPWGNVSGGWDEIFPQSSLKVNLKGNMPLNVGLTDLVLKDTFDFSFKQDFSKTHVKSGMIWLKATNAFPLSGDVTLYLMDATGNVIATIIGSDEVSSSVYGSVVNGILQKQSYVEFVIPDNVVDLLETVKQLSVSMKLNTPNANTNVSEQVMIPEKAFFGFKIGAKLKVEARI